MAEDIDKLVKLAREAAHSIRTDATASQVGLSDEETDLIADALERLLSRVSELEAELALANDECKDFERSLADTGPQAQVSAETGVSVVPDGWQLVPKEPSWEILIDHGIDSDTWAALLAASPSPPAAEAVGGDSVFNVIEPYSQSDGDGPAAPTASDDWPTGFKPDWKLTPHEQIAVTLNLALAKVPDWPGCTDEQLDALAQAVLSSPPVVEMVSVIAEAIRLHDIDQQMWMPTPTGQKWRHSASSILSRFQSVGGEKHDHADGALAEAVEKVTNPNSGGRDGLGRRV